MNLSVIGIALVAIGWIVQLWVARRTCALSVKFIALYALGNLIIAAYGWQAGRWKLSVGSLALAVLALSAGFVSKKARRP